MPNSDLDVFSQPYWQLHAQQHRRLTHGSVVDEPERRATALRISPHAHCAMPGTGDSFATIYSGLNAAFHVGKYSDIIDARWAEGVGWLQQRIDTAERRRSW